MFSDEVIIQRRSTITHVLSYAICLVISCLDDPVTVISVRARFILDSLSTVSLKVNIWVCNRWTWKCELGKYVLRPWSEICRWKQIVVQIHFMRFSSQFLVSNPHSSFSSRLYINALRWNLTVHSKIEQYFYQIFYSFINSALNLRPYLSDSFRNGWMYSLLSQLITKRSLVGIRFLLVTLQEQVRASVQIYIDFKPTADGVLVQKPKHSSIVYFLQIGGCSMKSMLNAHIQNLNMASVQEMSSFSNRLGIRFLRCK